MLLSNSSDILTSYPDIDPSALTKDEGCVFYKFIKVIIFSGIQSQLLGHHIKELNELIAEENKLNKLLENKIFLQQEEIIKLRQE